MDGLDRSEPPPTVNDNMPRREMVLWINSARLVELLAFSPKFEIWGQRKKPRRKMPSRREFNFSKNIPWFEDWSDAACR